MKTNILKVIFLGFVVLFAFNADASTCGFSRDLMDGSRGEDVRCLQQYLSDSGFSVNNYPDGIFGPRTRQSVTSWQARYGIPMFGYFDSTSRNKYFELVGGNNGWSTNDSSRFSTVNDIEQRALARINDALIMIEDAKNEIDDSNRNTSSAENSLDDAKDDILDSVIAFHVYRDFDEAYDKADDAYTNAEDAFEKAGGRSSNNNSDRNNANEAIDDARIAIDDARDEINNADDDGADVNDAEDLLNDAEDSLDDAENEYDDENYSDAEDLANEAENLANDAIDAIDW